jgi:hypothetical protein
MSALLAFYLALGCAKILQQLICFLGGPFPRSPAVDSAGAIVFLVVQMAYLAFVTVAYFAGLLLPPAAATTMSLADLGRFAVLLFTLVSACLVFVVVPLAAVFFFLRAGKRDTVLGFSWNVLT